MTIVLRVRCGIWDLKQPVQYQLKIQITLLSMILVYPYSMAAWMMSFRSQAPSMILTTLLLTPDNMLFPYQHTLKIYKIVL